MRVEQKHEFLSDMVRSALAGRLAPADFQRPYVWNAEQVTAMYRSILRGWPIGSFVTWEPSSDVDMSAVAKGRLGPVSANGGAETILLDGQNRLATLVWTAFATGSGAGDGDWSEAERNTWMSGSVLCAVHGTGTIEFLPAEEAGRPGNVPLRDVMQSFMGGRGHLDAIGRAVSSGAGDDAVRWYFDEVAGRIREARVTVTNLLRAGTEDAREAFLHVCRVGQPMSEADFEAAVRWAPAPR